MITVRVKLLWIVSSCKPRSLWERYVAELRRDFDIDVFGERVDNIIIIHLLVQKHGYTFDKTTARS